MNFSLPSPTPMEFTSKAADYLYGIFHEDPFLCGACIRLAADKVEQLERKQRLTDRTIGARWNTQAELWEMRKVLNAMLSYAVEVYPHTLSSTMDPAFNRHVKA
jgi:hypothetical protein